MFCPKCKSILLPKKKGNKQVMCCTSCSYTSTEGKAVISEKVVQDQKKIDVVKSGVEPLPTTDVTCPKCGHTKDPEKLFRKLFG